MKYLLTLLILIPLNAWAQEAEGASGGAIPSLADSLAAVNQVHGPYVGFSGEATDQYQNFLLLCEQATEAELLELCEHENAVVRAYAFWALARQQYDHLDSVLLAHSRDETLITEIQGGVMTRVPLIDFMQWVVSPDMMDAQSKKLDAKVLERVAELRFSNR